MLTKYTPQAVLAFGDTTSSAFAPMLPKLSPFSPSGHWKLSPPHLYLSDTKILRGYLPKQGGFFLLLFVLLFSLQQHRTRRQHLKSNCMASSARAPAKKRTAQCAPWPGEIGPKEIQSSTPKAGPCRTRSRASLPRLYLNRSCCASN